MDSLHTQTHYLTCPARSLATTGSTVGSVASEDDELVRQMIKYADRHRSSVSMHTLLETGRGRLLDGRGRIGVNDRLSSDSVHNVSSVDEQSGSQLLERHRRMLVQMASFLHRELPIRLAHRARELDNMPEGL
eukprot:SAG22_NODE_66_length_22936_cov_626.714279_16_plen_133_part_00